MTRATRSKLPTMVKATILSTVTRSWARGSVLAVAHLVNGELCHCIAYSFHLFG